MPLSRRNLVRSLGFLSAGQFMTAGCTGTLTKLKSFFGPKPNGTNTVQIFLEGPWLLSSVPDPKDKTQPNLLAATTFGGDCGGITHTCLAGIFDPKASDPTILTNSQPVVANDPSWIFDRSDGPSKGDFKNVTNAFSQPGASGIPGVVIDTAGKGVTDATKGRQILLPMPDTITPIAQQVGVLLQDQNGNQLAMRPYCVVALGYSYSGTGLSIVQRKANQPLSGTDNLVFRMQYTIPPGTQPPPPAQHFQCVQTELMKLVLNAPKGTVLPTYVNVHSEKWHWPHPAGSYNPPLTELGLNGCDDDNTSGGCIQMKILGSADCVYGGGVLV